MRGLAIFSASFSAAVLAVVYGKPDRFLILMGVLSALGAAAAALSISRTGRKGKGAAVCAAGLSTAFLWTAVYQAAFVAPVRVLDGQTVRLTAQVTQWPEESQSGFSVLVRADLPEGGTVDTLLYTDEQGAFLQPGDRIESVVYCTFADHTYDGEEITYYTAKGVFLRGVAYGTLTVERPEHLPLSALPAMWSRALEKQIFQVFPEELAGQVNAIVTGNRDHLTRPFTSSLRRAGLSHTTAVSGMHMAFLCGFLAMLLGRHRKRTSLIVIPVTLLFALVAGCTPSVVRAAVMVIMLHAAPLFERERDDVTALAAALLVLLIHNPMAAAHVGLQLSFAAVAGIFLTAEAIQSWLLIHVPQPDWRKRRYLRPLRMVLDYFVSTLAATLGASVLTIPLIAVHFSSVSLLSPLSNLLTLWAVAGIFGGGLLAGAAGLISPWASTAAAAVVVPVSRYLTWMVDWLGMLPFASITMDSFYYTLWTFFLSFAILFMLVKRSLRVTLVWSVACGAALGAAVVFTILDFDRDPFSVTALDVGQGQCALVRQGRHLTMVDCGGDSYDDPGDLAANYLQNAGKSRIDLLVLTHFHDDHANGVPQLLRRLQVSCIAMPEPDLEVPLCREILSLAEEKKIRCLIIKEDLHLEPEQGSRLVLYAPLGDEQINERGLTVLAGAGEQEALLTGDMNGEVEQLLLDHADLPDIELLFAGHHGSKYSTSLALLEAVRPELVLISAGQDNLYGHPSPETLERLQGCSVYRTDLEGAVTVRFSQKMIDTKEVP